MPLTISCPSCRKQLVVNEAAFGRQASCPHCKRPFLVPTPPVAKWAPAIPAPPVAKRAPAIPASPALESPSRGPRRLPWPVVILGFILFFAAGIAVAILVVSPSRQGGQPQGEQQAKQTKSDSGPQAKDKDGPKADPTPPDAKEKPPATTEKDSSPKDEGKPTVASLVKQLNSNDQAQQIKAAEGLRQMGADARPAAEAICRAAAISPAQEVRQAALEALGKVRPDLYPHVVSLLVNPKQDGQRAVLAVAELKENGRPATPVLLWYFKWVYDDSQLKHFPAPLNNAIYALRLVGASDPEVIKVLSDLALSDDVSRTRLHRASCVDTLGQIGKANPALRKQILVVLLGVIDKAKPLADPERGGTSGLWETIRAIGELGPDAKDAIPILKKLKFDSNTHTRNAATEALGKIDK